MKYSLYSNNFFSKMFLLLNTWCFMNKFLQNFFSIRIKYFLPVFLLYFPFSIIIAQTGKISGKVTDENGEPLIGANVLIDGDRKSTRLNSSHVRISYAVFC